MLFFLQRDTRTSAWMNKLAESDPASEEKATEYVIETNPFFKYPFKGGYLDFGLLLELARTGMCNTSTRWNSVSHSDQKDVLWTTSPYLGWSTSWEEFSHGSQWFFATGCEAYSSIGIYKRTSLLFRLTLLRKYSFVEKINGESKVPEGGQSYKFYATHTRYDRKTETWMTGSFGFAYGLGPVQLLTDLQLLLAYLIHQKTRLRGNQTELFERSKKNLWQVQESTTLRVLVVYALSG